MKTLFWSLFILALILVGYSSLRAQTADEVISKYVEAVGGHCNTFWSN